MRSQCRGENFRRGWCALQCKFMRCKCLCLKQQINKASVVVQSNFKNESLFISVLGQVEADPEYKLIVEANNVSAEIDNEIGKYDPLLAKKIVPFCVLTFSGGNLGGILTFVVKICCFIFQALSTNMSVTFTTKDFQSLSP